MGTVVVLGSLITDFVARAPRLPAPGETLIGEDFGTFLGGKGINQAITAARMGAHVTMIGRVGTDTFGDAFFPVLTREGIDSTHVTRDSSIGTGASVLIISVESGQNTIVAIPRANLTISADVVEVALSSIESGEKTVFLTQCETSQISYTTGLRRAREMGITTILNAAPIPPEGVSNDLLAYVDILVVNEVEAATLARVPVTSVESAQAAAEVLLMHGPKHIIVTLGVLGSLWSTREEGAAAPSHQMLHAFKVKAVDATAAGDSFCGALAAGLVTGMSMIDAVRQANAAGAVAVTRMGAIASLPTAGEVEAMLRS